MKRILNLVPLIYGQYLNLIAVFSTKRAAKIGLNIFCTIRKGKVLPSQKAFLDPAKLELEQVGTHQIQSYRWAGSGDTVLLMHGWESNTHRWRNLIKKLQEHQFNIIAFDAPAHGYSSGNRLHVPLYAEASRYLLNKYQPKHVVAHSMGGITILYDHFKTPESSVAKIVTIGSPSRFSQSMEFYQNLLKFNDRVKEAMNKYLKTWLGYYIDEFTSVRFVAQNQKKGLLFHDKDDLQVPFYASEEVHQHWKGSQLIATQGLGHSMHQDAVNEQIIAFLAS